MQSSLWTGWEFSVFSLRQHRGVGSQEDSGSAPGLPLATCTAEKTAQKKVDMSLQRNCTAMSLQQNCTDMCEHDCACLTCKTYRRSWPQAALSSAHADHFLKMQVRPADQAGYPEILQRASLDRALQVSSVPLQV